MFSLGSGPCGYTYGLPGTARTGSSFRGIGVTKVVLRSPWSDLERFGGGSPNVKMVDSVLLLKIGFSG